jgi:hypothetical protein
MLGGILAAPVMKYSPQTHFSILVEFVITIYALIAILKGKNNLKQPKE